MTIVLYLIYVLVCIFLIAVVLLQSGKGADLASAFGAGGSQAAVGARGAATALSKMTTWAAILFMILALTLSIYKSRDVSVIDSTVAAPATPAAASAPATAPSTAPPALAPSPEAPIQPESPVPPEPSADSPAPGGPPQADAPAAPPAPATPANP